MSRGADRIITALAVLAVVLATALALFFAAQPPLDLHAFRQTQTALTAYWFTREGYRLAYETPVAGYPWAIPFEFPIYQYLVAAISQLSGASVALVGRLVSFAFLLAALPVAAAINRRLGQPPLVFACFAALAFSAPFHVYWGRAVLIETTALFFALLAIRFFLDYLLGGRGLRHLVLFSIAISLCLLQKITTGLPALMVLGIILAVAEQGQQPPTAARRGIMLLLFLLPLALGFAWTRYTDAVKELNPLGHWFTSAALSQWNWGSPAQRLSAEFWLGVVWQRILVTNLGSVLGLGLIAVALLAPAARRTKAVVAGALALGLLPLLMFTNLHIVHEYYQLSALVFLIYAVAVALGAVVAPLRGGALALLLLAVIMLSNYVALAAGYGRAISARFDSSDRRVAVGEILRREVPPDGQFVAFGNDYSATFAYLAARKSLTVPDWFAGLGRVIARPEDFVEPGRLGAVVACGTRPDTAQLLGWASARGGWKVGETGRCAIAVPEVPLTVQPVAGTCPGTIETSERREGAGRRLIAVSGWTAQPGPPVAAADRVFLRLSPEGGAPVTLEALRIPRTDPDPGKATADDTGFSRLLPEGLSPGRYRIDVVQQAGDRAILCDGPGALLVVE